MLKTIHRIHWVCKWCVLHIKHDSSWDVEW